METTFTLNPPNTGAYSEWLILRILFEFGGMARFCNTRHGWQSDEIARALGLPPEAEHAENMPQVVKTLLGQRYRALQQQPRQDADHALLENNIEAIAACVKLNAAETEIVRLLAYMQLDSAVVDALNLIGRAIDLLRLCRLLADMFKLPLEEIRTALQPNQKLMRLGFIAQRNRHSRDIDDYLNHGDILNADQLNTHPFSQAMLLDNVLQPSPPVSLAWADFSHIGSMAERARDYLRHVYRTQRKGGNLLLYGAPGTGKTEFAALLAQQLAVPCLTLGSTDEDGDMLCGQKKLQNAQLAHTLLNGQSALLVFDEAEDVFADSLFRRSVAQSHKAWMNQLLENNSVPTVWISNDVGCMDPAFVRRFDVVLEIPDLPQQQKAALIETLAPQPLPPHEVAYLAKQQGLTPAMLTRSFQVAATLAEDGGDFSQHVFSLLNQTMQAQGKRRLNPPPATQAAYDVQWVACEQDLQQISHRLQRHPQGRICCYGPPGTGKTAWANWLGGQTGMPVLLKQGSDLLGKYVGETEQNIAAAFAQARDHNMLLVLDEVDSLLFAREGAERSWERSMVNEMLTQIEYFEGLLVVSTNLMHSLDSAALRRFDLKLAFTYLKPQQAQALAAQQAALLQLPALSAAQQGRLNQLTQLTPGDFAAVTRRHRFAPFACTDDWLAALAAECALKPEAVGGRMGFV